jgi:hypothetical protein
MTRNAKSPQPAAKYLHSMADALTFIRYAETALARAVETSPDPQARVEAVKVSANCRQVLGQLKETRNHALSRYTPRGERKPDQLVTAPTTNQRVRVSK